MNRREKQFQALQKWAAWWKARRMDINVAAARDQIRSTILRQLKDSRIVTLDKGRDLTNVADELLTAISDRHARFALLTIARDP